MLEIMLCRPRLLLSALALGMCVLSLVVDPPVLSFLCFVFVLPPGSGFVISLCISMPVWSAAVGGQRWWAGVVGDVCCLFFLLLQLATGS